MLVSNFENTCSLNFRMLKVLLCVNACIFMCLFCTTIQGTVHFEFVQMLKLEKRMCLWRILQVIFNLQRNQNVFIFIQFKWCFVFVAFIFAALSRSYD